MGLRNVGTRRISYSGRGRSCSARIIIDEHRPVKGCTSEPMASGPRRVAPQADCTQVKDNHHVEVAGEFGGFLQGNGDD